MMADESGGAPRATVLVVDDDPVACRYLDISLSRIARFNIEVANDVQGAMDILSTSPIDLIIQSRDLVKVPAEARNDTRFDLQARESHLGWWPARRINESETLYVDRPTGDKIAGRVPWNSPLGRSRILWVDEGAGRAFYRELEF